MHIKTELDRIVSVVQVDPRGMSFAQILQLLDGTISRRTLQRRLATLVQEGRLKNLGYGRSLHYVAEQVRPSYIVCEPDAPYYSIAQRQLHPEGRALEVRRYVSQPLADRKAVSYQHDFLHRYQPNATFYLSEPVRKHLHRVGTPPDGKHPAGTFAKQIFNKLLIDLSWNSSRLEGNTYSRIETERLLLQNAQFDNKSTDDTLMIINHKDAIEFLIESADIIGFNRYTIFMVHGLLARGLLSNPASRGQIRKMMVAIGKTAYSPINIPHQLEELFDEILHKINQINDPFEQAFFAMVHLPYLQPFEDINKRVSRLSANIPLIHNNLCPLSFVDVAERDYIDGILGVYELNDTALLSEVFVWAYERSASVYSVIKNEIGEPDRVEFLYLRQIANVVQEVVQRNISMKDVADYIRDRAKSEIPEEHRARFEMLVERELNGLHEGIVGIYHLSVEEFNAWKKIWRS